MKKDNSRYHLQEFIEVKTKSQAGIEYIKYKPIYKEVSKKEFYESFQK